MTILENTWERESQMNISNPNKNVDPDHELYSDRPIKSMAGYDSAFFDVRDIVAAFLAASMLIGPLWAYTLGLGA